MRNVLTHLYDTIDLDRVIAAVDPAIALYEGFATWAAALIEARDAAPRDPADTSEGGTAQG